MAFPTTGVLDPFNAPGNQNLTARQGWNASVLVTADASMKTDSAPTPSYATGDAVSNASNYWDTQWINVESWCTFSSTPASNFRLFARITVTGSITCYGLSYDGSSTLQMQRYAASTPTSIGSAVSQVVSSGDSIGLECIGSAISAYYKPTAGNWSQIATVTDSTIAATGNIGLRDFSAAVTRVTDFGGGTVIAAVPSYYGGNWNQTAIKA